MRSRLPRTASSPGSCAPAAARSAASGSATCRRARARRGAITASRTSSRRRSPPSSPRDEITPAERDELIESERLRVEPEFNSTRYGRAAYCQLADDVRRRNHRGRRRRVRDGRLPRSLSAAARRQPADAPGRIHARRHQCRDHFRYLEESHHESRPQSYNLQPAQALQPRRRPAGARSARCRLERAIVHHALSAAAARRRRHRARRADRPTIWASGSTCSTRRSRRMPPTSS